VVKVREISGYVEGEAVPSDPLLHVNPDAGDLATLCPDSSVVFATFPPDPEVLQSANQALLELPQEPMKILPMLAEIEDRVSDQLPGSVKGDVSTALNLEQLDSPLLQGISWSREVFRSEAATEGDDRCMLHQQEYVAFHLTGNSALGKRALQV
jgi:hypothetical protein